MKLQVIVNTDNFYTVKKLVEELKSIEKEQQVECVLTLCVPTRDRYCKASTL